MATNDLLAEIEAFLARPDVAMSPTLFGKLAVNDGKLIPGLRNGRRLWPETEKRIREFMRDYQVPDKGQAPPRQQAGAA